jgi:hypothetical protein
VRGEDGENGSEEGEDEECVHYRKEGHSDAFDDAVSGFGFRISGFGFRVLGSGSQVQCSVLRVSGSGFLGLVLRALSPGLGNL